MDLRLQKAIQQIEAGHFEHALKELKEIVSQCDHETKYSIAQLYYELGLVDLAKEVVEELLMLYPDEGELYTFLAELLIDLDNEDEAIDMLLEVKEDDPAYVQAQLLLADLYQIQGLDEVAEQKLLAIEKYVPNEPVIWYGLGEFYLSKGDYMKSIPYYKKAIPFEKDLQDANIALRLAEAYSASGYFEDALMYYKKGIKSDSFIDAHFGFGYTALQLREFRIAIQQFEQVLEMDESYSNVYPYLAECYEEEGRIDDALTTLKKGILQDEYHEALYIQSARLHINKGNNVEGEELLRNVLAINPSNIQAAHMLVQFLYEEEKFEEIVELVNSLKLLGEEDPLLDWFLAKSQKEMDLFDDALEGYRELEGQLANDSDFLEEYGEILIEAGDRKKGILMLTKAIEFDSSKLYLQEILLRYTEEEAF